MTSPSSTTYQSSSLTHYASRITHHALPILLLLAFFLQVLTASTQNSLTSDEGPQLTSGYSYLVTSSMHLIEFDGHPPLAKVLNALPLLLVPDLGSPVDVPSWQAEVPISLLWVTEEFFYPYRPLDRLVLAGRVPVALLGVLLLALIYRWAADLFGRAAGVGALLLAAFDPNLLAHAGLATNDLAVTLGCFAALFTFWRFARRPTVLRALLAGLVLGLALGTKLNALLLVPVEGALVLVFVVWGAKPAHVSRLRFGAKLLAGSALAWVAAGLALWAGYGFELRTLPGWSFPLPAATHLLLWQRVAQATGGGHPAFLMGELSTTGWWTYFPVAFALKTPLPTLLAMLAAGVTAALGWRRRWVDELALLLFVVLYAAAIAASRLNIGYRHMLPLLPFLLVFAARLFDGARWRALAGGRGRAVVTAAGALWAIWLVAGTLAVWPFHLAFFNALAGGPDGGYRYLVDSNTDWGQAVKALQRYMQREGLERVRLSTYIEYDAALDWYGVDYEPLPPLHAAPGVLPARFNPAPGTYAISTTTLQGVLTADPEMYDWFRQREPDARIGHVLFVYRVPETDPAPGWVAQCFVPLAPLPPEVVAEGFGRDDLRLAYFDCTSGWLWPGGGRVPGWYALHRETALADDPFVDEHLGRARLSYTQKINRNVPAFAIYEQTAAPPDAICGGAPLSLEGPLEFLGHSAPDRPARAGETIDLQTCWRVTGLPDRPLSLMLHLIGPDGTAVVADGLGVPIDQWQVGDVIVQRHRLLLPPDGPGGTYQVATGAYWLDTFERWPLRDTAGAGDQVLLPSLQVVEGR